jgi:hypothetical protein
MYILKNIAPRRREGRKEDKEDFVLFAPWGQKEQNLATLSWFSLRSWRLRGAIFFCDAETPLYWADSSLHNFR